MSKRESQKDDDEPDYTDTRSLQQKGGSLVISLPAGFVRTHDLQAGETVEVDKYQDKCIVRPGDE